MNDWISKLFSTIAQFNIILLKKQGKGLQDR